LHCRNRPIAAGCLGSRVLDRAQRPVSPDAPGSHAAGPARALGLDRRDRPDRRGDSLGASNLLGAVAGRLVARGARCSSTAALARTGPGPRLAAAIDRLARVPIMPAL